MNDLEQRLQALEDERAIVRTLHRYGHSIDGGDEEAWVDCFTADGTFRAAGRDPSHTFLDVSGREALREFIAGHSRRPRAHHIHCVVEPIVTLEGDEASCVSYLFVLQEVDGGPVLRVFGRYYDRLRRCDDGVWRFSERRAEIDTMLRGAPPLVGANQPST